MARSSPFYQKSGISSSTVFKYLFPFTYFSYSITLKFVWNVALLPLTPSDNSLRTDIFFPATLKQDKLVYCYLYYTLHAFTFNDNVQITFLFVFFFFIPLFFLSLCVVINSWDKRKIFEVDKVAVVQPKDDKTSLWAKYRHRKI